MSKISDALNGFIAGTLDKIADRIEKYREGPRARVDALVLREAAKVVRENRHLFNMPDVRRDH